MSNQSRRDRRRKGKKAGDMAFGITFLLYFIFVGRFGFGGLFGGLIVAGLVSSIVRSMASGLDLNANNNQSAERKARAAKPVEAVVEEKPVAAVPTDKTGNPEVDAILDKGRRTILQIRAENKRIPDELLTRQLDQLEILCGEIFRAVHDKPEKASQIRKFMDYYLPTTLKIVSTYRVISERGVFGNEMAQARQRIEDALGTVIKGCQKLLSKLYQDDVLDITTDIDVLEQMLKRDGLTETELQIAAEQARRAAEINQAIDQRARSAAPQPAQQISQTQQQSAASAGGSQAQQIEY
ncbi:MAG TPA: 5-bromo-4-chloroindolyl phosphate hydrolysis family protein [Candidatus Limiplasma sp.]|nr:5-bromo-4-chloroindolyl phosphate hydrolysis family protein [Candidatus Limiplasma sp.]HRX08397.1 5-bromo-4-chloroindolyl phosphate hydrolysis family protein [Candidatus Limiplasma sp.]